MSKKLIGFVPLLAIVAAMMVPAGAQALTPHWYKEGSPLPAAVQEPVYEYGDLTLKGAAELSCHNAIGGYVENPTGGEAGNTTPGIAATEAFATYKCTENYSCGGLEGGAGPNDLPWLGTLKAVTPSEIRAFGNFNPKYTAESEKAAPGETNVTIGCQVPPEDHIAGTKFVAGKQGELAEGTGKPLAPFGINAGTSCLHPGKFNFNGKSGNLEAEGSKGTVTGVTEGFVQMCSFSPSPEHINVVNN
jgi:hypothetical protein